MRRRTFVPLLAATAGLTVGAKAAVAQSGGWAPLFNGRDFEGWDRIGDAKLI